MIRLNCKGEPVKVQIHNLPHDCCMSGKRRFKLNMNKYRNTHYKDLAKAKRGFTKWVGTLGLDFSFECPVHLHYRLTCRNKADLMNYGAVLDKFMQDGLVKFKMLPDDNVKHVKKITFEFVGNSRQPTGMLEISPLNGKEEK